jgi:hypothetical protein
MSHLKESIMEKLLLYPFYFPLYCEFADQAGKSQEPDLSPVNGSRPVSSPMPENSMNIPDHLSAGELVENALLVGFTPVQTAILLLKNTFEGYLYCSFHLTSRRFFSLIRDTPDKTAYYSDFVRDFSVFPEFRAGVSHGLELLRKQAPTTDFPAENGEIIDFMMTNHLILFPVGYFRKSVLPGLNPPNFHSWGKSRDLINLAELEAFAINHLGTIHAVNRNYEQIFQTELEMVRVAYDTMTYLEQKRLFVTDIFPGIWSEEELNKIMGDYLMENKLKEKIGKAFSESGLNTIAPKWIQSYKEGIKSLYRQCSRNCSELLISDENGIDNDLKEISTLYQQMNIHYREMAGDNPSEVLLKFCRLLLDLSQILTFRKMKELNLVTDNKSFLGKAGIKLLVPPDEFPGLDKVTRNYIFDYAFNSRFENKLFLIGDEEMIHFHRQYLLNQHKAIGEEITKIREEITALLCRNRENIVSS